MSTPNDSAQASAAPAPAPPELLAAATGAWPGADPREAAAAGFTQLAGGYPPVPLVGVAVEDPAAARDGGGRAADAPGRNTGRHAWRIDPVGLALALADGLHADVTSYGWRLTLSSAGSRDRDLTRVTSTLARTIEACEEYGAGFAGRMLLSLPGPWAVLRRLSLPGGNPALDDAGARRDVVQAYALGLESLLARFARALGTGGSQWAPRVRLVEPDLDAILTGRLPTVSGYRNLAAIPDAQVSGALRSFARRSGDDTILALPQMSSVTIGGKAIGHRQLAADAGITALAVPLPEPAAVGDWEEIAQAHESGIQVWLHLPPAAGRAPDRVKRWVAAVSDPWHKVGMNSVELTRIGILGGVEPLAAHPAAGTAAAGVVPDEPAYGSAHYQLAAHLAQALKEENE